jgi:hypothetical protein
MVWPSIFDSEVGPGMPTDERNELHLAGVRLPDWIGPNRPLWEDLETLKKCLSTVDSAPRPFWIIAISLDGDSQTVPYAAQLLRLRPPDSWEFLGFDVSDSGLLSGLSNCGYDASEMAGMRLKWGQSLNQFHLFDDLTTAITFRDFTDARVPEHAPFYVYGLWKIAESGSQASHGHNLAP